MNQKGWAEPRLADKGYKVSSDHGAGGGSEASLGAQKVVHLGHLGVRGRMRPGCQPSRGPGTGARGGGVVHGPRGELRLAGWGGSTRGHGGRGAEGVGQVMWVTLCVNGRKPPSSSEKGISISSLLRILYRYPFHCIQGGRSGGREVDG